MEGVLFCLLHQMKGGARKVNMSDNQVVKLHAVMRPGVNSHSMHISDGSTKFDWFICFF